MKDVSKMATPKKDTPKRRILKVKLAKEGKRILQASNPRRMEFGKDYDVPDAPFWRRRVRDGDLTLIKGPDMPTGTPVIHGEDKAKKAADKKAADNKSGSKK